INSPYFNFWDGGRLGNPLFQGIRDCNTFLSKIDEVPDMEGMEKDRWKSEVMFLKAYYHWYLLRMYGPIPIVDQNKPVSADVQGVKVYRQPVDSCFHYIVNLIDTAIVDLPDKINLRISELGRITKPIALAMKARILMNAASPLFNGNANYANMVDNKGRHLFNATDDPEKWEKAKEACKQAIEASLTTGHQLYHFSPQSSTYNVNDTLRTQMSIRNAICERWNSEIIWGYSTY